MQQLEGKPTAQPADSTERSEGLRSVHKATKRMQVGPIRHGPTPFSDL